jgi:serine/threonine-protein kinase
MAEEKLRLRPGRRRGSQSTPTGMTTTGHATLPPELVGRAISRLGWTGLVYACTYFVIHWIQVWSHRHDAFAQASWWFYSGSMAVGVGLGLTVFFLARSKKLPPLVMLDIGLLFEVAAGLMIGVAEACRPLLPTDEVRGVSSLTVWVVFFALVVPTTLGKAILASFATAAMGPLAMAVGIVVKGNPNPTLGQWLTLYLPPFLMAFWSVALSRYIYKLGAQMAKAGEVGSYELVELIGRGGMGEVWKAKHRMLARQAAIKIIGAEALCCTSEQEIAAARRRFEREAQATAALHSPHTVALYDYGVTDDGVFFYVMELLQGLDLETFIENHGPQQQERVIYVLRQICESLAEAHACGLTHRDIKPKNIFLCRLGLAYDFVKVLDFGLVKTRDNSPDQTRLTRDGVATGTPAFMSPEMAMGRGNVDSRADIYALGCVAYWLLTGHLVFDASTPLAMALEHVQSEPVPLSQRTEIEISPELERVIMDCLQKDPARRPQTARELNRMLAGCPGATAWSNELGEEWWRMHLPAQAQCGPAALESHPTEAGRVVDEPRTKSTATGTPAAVSQFSEET